MKAMQAGLWSVWLSGIALICLSLYATQKVPSFQLQINQPSFDDSDAPKITVFSAPASVGKRQSLAIRSWLALSSQITVVLFTQHPSAASFAASFNPSVLVDTGIDFTFLGTPFFHSMLERSMAFTTDVSVFINPETVLLPDFISTLNYAYKNDRDWLLFASLRNVSSSGNDGKHWLIEDGKWMKLQEDIPSQNVQWSHCDDRLLLAWNNRNVPLHNGVLPPFLYGKGIHNHWVINEAASAEFRVVFDASWVISSLSLNDPEYWYDQSVRGSNVSHIQNSSWEDVGNAHLGAQYGSAFFNEINYSRIVKLLKCDGQYLFVDSMEHNENPFVFQSSGVWNRRPWLKKKNMACDDNVKLENQTLHCSLRDQLMSLPPLYFPFSLVSILSVIADRNKTVVLAVAGYSYKDMLMSWVCRLRRLMVKNFVICALDHETYEFSILQGLPVFLDTSAPSNISFNDCHFGTKCFQRVTKVKSRVVLQILKLGYSVLLSDVDVYWFGNPLPYLCSFGSAVLVAQSDEYNITGPINLPRRLNSGFYFARSDGATVAAMEKVVKHAATSGLSEQPSFYDILCGEGGSNRISDDRCVEPETNLTVHFLDRNLFPNGAYLELWQKKNVKAACLKKGCLILHNNWISGRIKKLERQVLSGLWEYDGGKRMCLQRWHSLNQGSHEESSMEKQVEAGAVSFDLHLQSKDIFVRIIHAGGREELYQSAVPASQVLEKYPGMCVARPEVFKNPLESLLCSDENLMPGHKYLIIPSTTAQKLKRKHMEKVIVRKYSEIEDEMTDVNITWDAASDISDESVSSAKEFYVSKDRRSRQTARKSVAAKKPFVPPLPRAKTFRGTGWEPSLTSVQELSP